MSLKDFLEMYDNWNGNTQINGDNLETIVEGNTCKIYDNRVDLHEKHVVAFGFYDGVLTVRIK